MSHICRFNNDRALRRGSDNISKCKLSTRSAVRAGRGHVWATASGQPRLGELRLLRFRMSRLGRNMHSLPLLIHGDPATRHELPPVAASRKYPEFIDGPDEVFKRAKERMNGGRMNGERTTKGNTAGSPRWCTTSSLQIPIITQPRTSRPMRSSSSVVRPNREGRCNFHPPGVCLTGAQVACRRAVVGRASQIRDDGSRRPDGGFRRVHPAASTGRANRPQ